MGVLERDRGYPRASRAHVWKGRLNEAQTKGSVIRAMDVHYFLSLLLSWARMSWQKQLKIRFNLAHGSRIKSAVVDSHPSSSLRQLVTSHPHLGSRGQWCSFWAHFLIIQPMTSAHLIMLSIAKIFFPGSFNISNPTQIRPKANQIWVTPGRHSQRLDS